MATNFHIAPPARVVDGLLAVPVDIESVSATFTFDGATQTATADATITYTVGPTAGHPIFDLRQVITQAWLDGAAFPAAQLAHHAFGAGAFTGLRIIASVQAAGSVHTLRVQYTLALPDAERTTGYLPALDWAAGPRLRFVFGFSDLYRGRYAESWLPANLQFDQYSIALEIRIINTMAAHSVISNGTVTTAGANHWQIAFPARFSSLSPMLEVRATDTLVQQTDTTVLPVSGRTVTIEAWRPVSSAVNLATAINDLKTYLADNETGYGSYLHDDRFVAFFNGGGMEYEGGTTTDLTVARHEAFHSWFARGVKPAAQADGWWDEGFTTWHDFGANDAVPFDFTAPPVLLCSRDLWQRHTPQNAYDDGRDFFEGLAAQLTVSDLNALMAAFYQRHQGSPASTQMLEEFLTAESGEPRVVDAFHRFVYGLADPAPAPDLWMRDDTGHTGADLWNGRFWDSPDLWIRNADDGGTTHQSPESGQDNWFHARVRNAAGAGAASHFVVTFHARGFAGTQFVYPADFLPCTAAKAEFDLAPGMTSIVKARWPRVRVPAAGTHTCLLASILARGDPPVAGRHVWEHNNLAQKNLTVVDLLPDMFMILPVLIANWTFDARARFTLELRTRPAGQDALRVSLLSRHKELFRAGGVKATRWKPDAQEVAAPQHQHHDCGAHLVPAEGNPRHQIMTSATPDLVLRRFPDGWEVRLDGAKRGRLPVELPLGTQALVGLRIAVPRDARPDQTFTLDFVQRHAATRQIVGGVAVEIHTVGEQGPLGRTRPGGRR